MPTALVTGASAGLGREFAEQLAARGHDLVLVARDRDRLREVAEGLMATHGVAVEALPADLADRTRLQAVADRLAAADRPIDLLVNNAGFGIRTAFGTGDVAEEERALDVMVRAVLVLSHAAAGPMRGRGHGAILNVSSVAGYAVMGSYSAIKAWVTVFSEGLAGELAPAGVRVTAVCPGYVHTEFHERARITMDRLPERLWLHAPDVVREALDDLASGRVVSVPSRRYRVMAVVLRHAPRALVRRGSRQMATRRRAAP